MKKYKKIAAILALGLCLTACGNNVDDTAEAASKIMNKEQSSELAQATERAEESPETESTETEPTEAEEEIVELVINSDTIKTTKTTATKKNSEESAEKTSEKSTEKSSEKSSEKNTDKSSEKSSESSSGSSSTSKSSDSGSKSSSSKSSSGSSSLETEIKEIRDNYYWVMNNTNKLSTETPYDGITLYTDSSGRIREITVDAGYYSSDPHGLGVPTGADKYTVWYYYDEDENLDFIFIFSGTEEHRLYVKNSMVLRYIDSNMKNTDYGADGAYWGDIGKYGKYVDLGLCEMECYW